MIFWYYKTILSNKNCENQSITLFNAESDKHQYCWKKSGKPLKNAHIKPTVKFGMGSIFIWGCFTSRNIDYLYRIDGGLNANLYRQILDEDFMKALQYYELNVLDIIFKQDNDLKHTAILTKQGFDNNNVEVLSWPPQSPDLNPIEHL
ncbi:unnamed protein product [Rhizophagus irregularis]|nr:unnamed protein product [Rhizophagus irregularis]